MATDFDEAAQGIRRLTVSVQQLGAIATYCTGVDGFIPKMRDDAYAADRKAQDGGPEKGSCLGSTSIPGVIDLGVRMDGVHREVDKALRNISTCLTKTATAMKRIAKEFDEVDERNKVSAETLAAYIEGRKR